MKKEDEKIVLYHYTRNDITFVTPNLQIAIARNESDLITVETTEKGITKMNNVEILHD